MASADMTQPPRLARGGEPVILFIRSRLCALGRESLRLTEDTSLDRMLDPAVRLATSTPGADPGGDYAGSSGHVHGALALTANWDLRPLARDLPGPRTRPVLVTGSCDGMAPPAQAERVCALVPQAEHVSLRGLGHLAHEEQPAGIATLLRRMVSREAAD